MTGLPPNEDFITAAIRARRRGGLPRLGDPVVVRMGSGGSGDPPVRLGDLIGQVERRLPDAGPLERLTDAVLTAERLNELADRLIDHFVDEARRSGASWTEIGRSLGVTKQAAQKRFAAPSRPIASATGRRVWERFTRPAKQAVKRGHEAARQAGHRVVDTDHVLLGLLAAAEDDLALRALAAQGVTADSARRAAIAALSPGDPDAAPSGHIPFSPHCKRLLELAVRGAQRMGHRHIGTGHILLALLDEDTGPGGAILAGLGATRDKAAAWLTAAMEDAAGAAADEDDREG